MLDLLNTWLELLDPGPSLISRNSWNLRFACAKLIQTLYSKWMWTNYKTILLRSIHICWSPILSMTSPNVGFANYCFEVHLAWIDSPSQGQVWEGGQGSSWLIQAPCLQFDHSRHHCNNPHWPLTINRSSYLHVQCTIGKPLLYQGIKQISGLW